MLRQAPRSEVATASSPWVWPFHWVGAAVALGALAVVGGACGAGNPAEGVTADDLARISLFDGPVAGLDPADVQRSEGTDGGFGQLGRPAEVTWRGELDEATAMQAMIQLISAANEDAALAPGSMLCRSDASVRFGYRYETEGIRVSVSVRWDGVDTLFVDATALDEYGADRSDPPPGPPAVVEGDCPPEVSQPFEG